MSWLDDWNKLSAEKGLGLVDGGGTEGTVGLAVDTVGGGSGVANMGGYGAPCNGGVGRVAGLSCGGGPDHDLPERLEDTVVVVGGGQLSGVTLVLLKLLTLLWAQRAQKQMLKMRPRSTESGLWEEEHQLT